MEILKKKHNTIGCCGIDCGLCPSFQSKSNSACPGCGGLNFAEKHPSCGFLTCCALKHNIETCASCNDFPCHKFDKERDGIDSFVTHKKVFSNLGYIKENGLAAFLKEQKARENILRIFLADYNEGRSKSFYCLACALLPIEVLEESLNFILSSGEKSQTVKNAKILREKLSSTAQSLKIALKLQKNKEKGVGIKR